MNRTLIAALLSLIVGHTAIAQTPSQSIIPDAPPPKPGHCHALVNVPAKLAPRIEEVLSKEASEVLEIIPAKYEWIEKRVKVSDEVKTIELIPVTYKTIEEQVIVEPERKEYEVIPAKFEKVSETMMVQPAMRVWKKSSNSAASLAGEVMRLIEQPAKYKTIIKQKMVSQPQVREVIIPAKLSKVEKKVIDKPATMREVIIPAEFKNIRVRQQVQAPQQVRTPIPAKTQKVSKNEVVSPAQLKWQRVPCDKDLNEKNIIALQKGLKAAGYDVTADGKFGKGSLEALEKFQERKELAKGAITIETMKALGVNIQ